MNGWLAQPVLQEASVIVLCFSMDKPGTLRRVSSYWMPELRRLVRFFLLAWLLV